MRKIAALAALAALMVVVPTGAAKPGKPDKPPKTCTAHAAGYNASGTLVMSSLTAAGEGRYNGTIEVDVAKANHGGPVGGQTFTLTDAKVRFHHGVDPTNPPAGSRVGLHGTITALPKGCSTTGFTPTVMIKKVDIRKAHSKPTSPTHPTKPTKPTHPAKPAGPKH